MYCVGLYSTNVSFTSSVSSSRDSEREPNKLTVESPTQGQNILTFLNASLTRSSSGLNALTAGGSRCTQW